ncbi:unnamed protein product [Lepidochelys olivacea]
MAPGQSLDHWSLGRTPQAQTSSAMTMETASSAPTWAATCGRSSSRTGTTSRSRDCTLHARVGITTWVVWGTLISTFSKAAPTWW